MKPLVLSSLALLGSLASSWSQDSSFQGTIRMVELPTPQTPRDLRAPARADAPYIPIPKRAKTFLDPVEMLLRSAPKGAIQKLRDDLTAENAAAELNRYFGQYALNKSIVLHTTVEAAEPHPDIRNAFRIRAASTPLEWEGGTMKRLSWLYFQPADGPKANSVKVGSEITIVGWIRRCEVVKTPDGLRLNFDLQYSRIEDSAAPL